MLLTITVDLALKFSTTFKTKSEGILELFFITKILFVIHSQQPYNKTSVSIFYVVIGNVTENKSLLVDPLSPTIWLQDWLESIHTFSQQGAIIMLISVCTIRKKNYRF